MSAPTVYGKAPPISNQLAEKWRRTPPARIYRFEFSQWGGLIPLTSLELVHRGTAPYNSHTRQIVKRMSALEIQQFFNTQIQRVVDQGYKKEDVNNAASELLRNLKENDMEACLKAQDAVRTQANLIKKTEELVRKVKKH